ncbi:MAG: hypothetical protein IJB72_01025, partial [Clostridia bacterium]|nr:hypothetical protein [Clostridia bacterium]
MKTKKLLSILLALMMMLSVVPMYASAADPIALTEANVTVWPTASGEIYFGQKISDGITLSGGEVQYDGAVVAGHFEFIDSELRPTSAGNQIAAIKFIPNDTSAYTGFEVAYAWDVTFKVNKTTPVFVDENDTVPVATEVEAGAALSTSTLSGAKVKNPYNESESKALAAKWRWTKTSTIVNESGYYQARMVIGTTYEVIYTDVYVKVAGEAVATTITEAPTASLTYDGVTTWADVELTGGKAMSGDTEVAGKFTIDNAGSTVIEAGTYTLNITFTPDDTENYLPSTGTATVTVNPAPIKFVDENGADIVPEITVPYGTTFSSGDDICIALKNYLIIQSGVARNVYVLDDEGNILDHKTTASVGTKEYKVIARTDNKNYGEAVLTFKLTVEATDVKVNILRTTKEILVSKANNTDPTPTGTFAIYVDGQLLKDGVKHNNPVEWNPTASKIYTIKAVYTPIENDPVNVEDVTITIPVALERKITYSD